MKTKLLSILILSMLLSACSADIRPQDVIDSFHTAGLECEDTRTMTANDYGMAPMGDDGLRFFIPSLGKSAGGRVIYYADAAYLDKAREYYEGLGKNNAALFSWVFVRGHVLVQINGKLPEARAREYERALQGAGD